MNTSFNIPPELIKATDAEKLNAVAGLASALDLNGTAIQYDLHKAAKGESIEAPHLNPMIWEIEKEFFGLWDAAGIVKAILSDLGIPHRGLAKSKKIVLYQPSGQPLTDQDMKRLEEILMNALHIDLAKVQKLIVQSAAAAKLARGDIMGTKLKIDLSMLPKTLQEAILHLKLNPIEVNAIKFAYQYAGTNITAVTDRAKAQIKNMVIEGIQNRTHPKTLANKMFNELALNDSSVLNRDWERVAITETNRSANDGFIASQPDGAYVVGDSHDDACIYCKRYINLKVYQVTSDPPQPYGHLDPTTKKYAEIAKRWEREIWVGKSNVGRSFSNRKVVRRKGVQRGRLQPRDHHEQGMPVLPLHPHCLPGNSLVTPRGEVTSVSKRWYDGDMIILKSASGCELICTPNHPILTDRGFLPADSLNVGSTIISDRFNERPVLVDGNDIDEPTRIEDIVESFLDSSEVTTMPMPISPPDFHGDGIGSKVAIIGTNRFLGNSIYAFVGEHQPKSDFKFADMQEFLFNSASMFYLCFKRYYSAFRSFVSRLDLVGALVGSHPIPLNLFGLRLAPGFNTSHREPVYDSGPGNSELLGQSINGYPLDIKADNLSDGKIDPDMIDGILAGEILSGSKGDLPYDSVTHIEVIPFSGYVYNIETVEGYYLANGITTHNCRCRWSEWIPDLYYIKDGRVEFAVDEESMKEHAEWLKANPHIQIGKT